MLWFGVCVVNNKVWTLNWARQFVISSGNSNVFNFMQLYLLVLLIVVLSSVALVSTILPISMPTRLKMVRLFNRFKSLDPNV